MLGEWPMRIVDGQRGVERVRVTWLCWSGHSSWLGVERVAGLVVLWSGWLCVGVWGGRGAARGCVLCIDDVVVWLKREGERERADE
jgi:hypothetical protein